MIWTLVLAGLPRARFGNGETYQSRRAVRLSDVDDGRLLLRDGGAFKTLVSKSPCILGGHPTGLLTQKARPATVQQGTLRRGRGSRRDRGARVRAARGAGVGHGRLGGGGLGDRDEGRHYGGMPCQGSQVEGRSKRMYRMVRRGRGHVGLGIGERLRVLKVGRRADEAGRQLGVKRDKLRQKRRWLSRQCSRREGGVGVKALVGRLTVGGGGVVNEDEKGQVGMPRLEECKCQSSTARNGGSSHYTGSGEALAAHLTVCLVLLAQDRAVLFAVLSTCTSADKRIDDPRTPNLDVLHRRTPGGGWRHAALYGAIQGSKVPTWRFQGFLPSTFAAGTVQVTTEGAP